MFDDVEAWTGAWEERYLRCCDIVRAENDLLQRTERVSVRLIVATYVVKLTARVVNLTNGVVLLLKRPNIHSAPAVARAQFETCAAAVYAEKQLVSRIRKGRIEQVHRLLYRLGLGTHPASGYSRYRAIAVDRLVAAMRREADELMAPTVPQEGLPPEAEGRPYGDAIERAYVLLSEFTHPNQPALSLSGVEDEPVLQPDVTDRLLGGVLRPVWIGLLIGGAALDRLLEATSDHPMELPNIDPAFPPEQLNPQ